MSSGLVAVAIGGGGGVCERRERPLSFSVSVSLEELGGSVWYNVTPDLARFSLGLAVGERMFFYFLFYLENAVRVEREGSASLAHVALAARRCCGRVGGMKCLP
jgi:hypothetical protein